MIPIALFFLIFSRVSRGRGEGAVDSCCVWLLGEGVGGRWEIVEVEETVRFDAHADTVIPIYIS